MSVQEDIAKMLENIELPEDMTKDDLELVLKLGLENFKTIGEHIKSKQTLMEKGKLDIKWIKSDLYRAPMFSGIGEFKLNDESLNTSPQCVISTLLRLDTGKIDINKISEDSCCKTVTPSPGGNFTNGSGGGGNWGDKDEL